MEINITKGDVSCIVYSDRIGTSQYFLPKMWIKWFSSERKIKLKTTCGDTIVLTPDALKKLNLKMVKITSLGGIYEGPEKPDTKYCMVINKPRRDIKRIPLLAISNKLQKMIGRTKINVDREYRERREKGYRYWEP